jgi:hypothetical protein
MKHLKVEFNPDNKSRLLLPEPDKVNIVKAFELANNIQAIIVAFYN